MLQNKQHFRKMVECFAQVKKNRYEILVCWRIARKAVDLGQHITCEKNKRQKKGCLQSVRCPAKEFAHSLWLKSLFLTFFLIKKKLREHWYNCLISVIWSVPVPFTNSQQSFRNHGHWFACQVGREMVGSEMIFSFPEIHGNNDSGWRPGVCPHLLASTSL